jgi:hypothetical protein
MIGTKKIHHSLLLTAALHVMLRRSYPKETVPSVTRGRARLWIELNPLAITKRGP